MKVKVRVVKNFRDVRYVEVEVDDPVVAKLDAFWRSGEIPPDYSPELNAMVAKAALAVEKATGIPFIDASAPETISCVYAMDGESILEC